MSVKTYSLKKDGEKNISEHFKVKEFRCKNGADTILISDELVVLLEKIRAYFGKPIHINSAYRTVSYNKSIGGASSSQHCKGTAADIWLDNIPPDAVSAWGEKFNTNGGTGRYATFTHVDVRGNKSLWNGKVSNNGVSSLKLGDIYLKYKAKDQASVSQSTPVPPTPSIEPITKDEIDMTFDEVKTKLLEDETFCETVVKKYRQKLQAKDTSSWAAEAMAKATEIGLIQGDEHGKEMGQDLMTREQFAVVVSRLIDYLKTTL